MLIKSKFLGDVGWKDLAAKNKLKDNGLAKSLEKLKRTGDDDLDDQTKILEEVVKLVAALKKDKAVAAAPAVVKYVGEVQGDAESAMREVAKARAEREKVMKAKAKAEAEKAAANKAEQEDRADEDEESPELLTTKLKPLLKLVAKGETMHALLAKSGKQVVVMLSRKPIPPARRKLLAEQLGSGSTKYYPGTCSLEAGATTFALKAEVAGLSKLVKAAVLEQTGLRLNKIKCRGEDGDDHDDDPDDVTSPSGTADGADDPASNVLAAAPDDPPPGGGLAPSGSPVNAGLQVPTLTIVTASGASAVLAGSTERFRASLTMPDGSPKDVTGEVVWDPSDRAVSISSMGYGEIKAGPGPLTVAASHAKSGARGSITVTVVARILKKILITPKNPLVEVGEFAPLRAIGEFSDGPDEDVTDRVEWESSREDYARPTSTGHCEGKAAGKAVIRAYDKNAMADGITEVTVHTAGKGPALVKVHVTPIDPTVTDFTPLQLTAMGEFADKSTHEVTRSRGIRWVSANPRVLAVDGNGLATPGLGTEIVRITAVDATGTVYGYTEVDVRLPVLQSVDISPRDPAMLNGDSVVLVVTGTFSSGPPRDITNQVVWTSTPPGVVLPVANSGVIQSLSEGRCDLTATVPGSTPDDTVAVTVSPPTITSIELEESGEAVTALDTPVGEDAMASAVLSDALIAWAPDDGRVHADTGNPGQKRPVVPPPDPQELTKVLDDLKAMDADRIRAANILPVTSALKPLVKKYQEARKDLDAKVADLVQKLKTRDLAGAGAALPKVKAAIPVLQAAMKALITSADAQDKAAMPNAQQAEKTVVDLITKGSLAAKTNAEKLELLGKLQGPATKRTEFRAAQREIYKTLKLDPTFLNEDAKKRDQVVKNLVGTAKDKAELKDKRDKWTTLSDSDRVALLKKVLGVHSKTLGIPVPQVVVEKKETKVSDTGDETIINGQYFPEDGRIHIYLNPDPRSKLKDFKEALGLIIHESLHHYQHELVKRLESRKLTKKDPEYEQALLFQINLSEAGGVPISEDPVVYRKQPLEEHAWLRGPETATQVLDAMN